MRSFNLIDSITDTVAIIDSKGEIIQTNRTWKNFATENGGLEKTTDAGINYLQVCQQAKGHDQEEAFFAFNGIKDVIEKKRDNFEMQYLCKSIHQDYWFLMKVSPVVDTPGLFIIIHIDITQRKSYELNLKRQKEKFNTLFNQLSDAVFIHKFKGRFIEVNKTAVKSLGFTKAELLKMTPLDIDSRRFAETFERREQELLKSGWIIFETELIAKNGKVIPIEVNSTLIEFEGEQLILSVARDISERLNSVQRIIKSEAKFQQLFNNLNNGVMLLKYEAVRDEFIIQSLNPVAAKIFTTDQESLIGKSIIESFPKIKETPVFNAFYDVLAKEHPISVPKFFYKDSIRSGWREATIYKLHHDEVVCIVKDVTDAVTAENMLLASQKRLKLRNQISVAFILNDIKKSFNSILNLILKEFQSTFGFFGYIDDQGVLVCPTLTSDLKPIQRIPEEVIKFPPEQWSGLFGQSLKEKKALIKNSRFNLPDGHVQLSNALAVPIIYNDNLIGQICIANKEQGNFTDSERDELVEICNYISPLLHALIREAQMTNKLIQAKESAEKSNKDALNANIRLNSRNKIIKDINHKLKKANSELDNFVYRVSHDLRAPITSSLGLSTLILQESNFDEIQKYSTLQIQSLKKLDLFITDILNYSRNSRLEVQNKKIDFDGLVDEVILENSYLLNHTNTTIHKEITNHNDFQSDPFRLKVILRNLISNALKYQKAFGENPYVIINIKASSKMAEIIIEDNGIGIKKEHQNHIFDMFYRATNNNPGSGIGLYILKEALVKLKGNIDVRSEYGKGTRFMLKIPASKVSNDKITA